MAEFEYKQRPFSRRLTDAEYDIATGRLQEQLPAQSPAAHGHMCNGTYKTFNEKYCPYCNPEPLL